MDDEARKVHEEVEDSLYLLVSAAVRWQSAMWMHLVETMSAKTLIREAATVRFGGVRRLGHTNAILGVMQELYEDKPRIDSFVLYPTRDYYRAMRRKVRAEAVVPLRWFFRHSSFIGEGLRGGRRSWYPDALGSRVLFLDGRSVMVTDKPVKEFVEAQWERYGKTTLIVEVQ